MNYQQITKEIINKAIAANNLNDAVTGSTEAVKKSWRERRVQAI